MKKVKVISTFIDKFNPSRVYNPGEVVEFDGERADHIIGLSLAEPVKEDAPAVRNPARKRSR